MPRIRTLNGAIKELKEMDPKCSLTITALRRKIRNKEIPYAQVGNKYLIDIDIVENILFQKRLEGDVKSEIERT
ncbi:MAG: hypothetical protein PHU94_03510 [Bacilli bacterium]|nr:hypothetical protein [Bacilli bacterium]MDD4718603.1 hypothetical protein [Bacilli bacterium]